jgi:hypothetical protein
MVNVDTSHMYNIDTFHTHIQTDIQIVLITIFTRAIF